MILSARQRVRVLTGHAVKVFAEPRRGFQYSLCRVCETQSRLRATKDAAQSGWAA